MTSKSILITGCSSGIGKYTALALQHKGYNVIASVRKAEDIAPLQAEGLQHVIALDLADSQSIDTAVARCLEITGGRLYALFNNGAYGQPGAIEDLTRETLRKQFETNVFGTHELTVKLLPTLLKEESARIIQNSSILGFSAMPMRGAYNASKFALEGLTDTLRLELANSNVRVSLIEPGPILTHFRKNALVALKQNISFSQSRFGAQYEAAVERLTKEGPAAPFTLGPDAVAQKVLHALEAKRPKVRYYVTFPTYLFAFIRHFLPYRILDKAVLLASKS
ncbi:putative oxidoreductase [Thalassocella blandensis]|nr:putative oxidoreductase [Thalassocella blandensis]